MDFQPSLLDAAADGVGHIGVGPLAGRVQRTELRRGAWVDVLPGWFRRRRAVPELLEAVPWRAERRQMYDREVDVPRLLCWYGGEDALPHPVLGRGPRRALNDHYAPELGEPFVTAGCGCTATAATASPGTATGSAGRARGHDGGDRLGRVAAPLMLRPRAAAARGRGSRSVTAT